MWNRLFIERFFTGHKTEIRAALSSIFFLCPQVFPLIFDAYTKGAFCIQIEAKKAGRIRAFVHFHVFEAQKRPGWKCGQSCFAFLAFLADSLRLSCLGEKKKKLQHKNPATKPHFRETVSLARGNISAQISALAAPPIYHNKRRGGAHGPIFKSPRDPKFHQHMIHQGLRSKCQF